MHRKSLKLFSACRVDMPHAVNSRWQR